MWSKDLKIRFDSQFCRMNMLACRFVVNQMPALRCQQQPLQINLAGIVLALQIANEVARRDRRDRAALRLTNENNGRVKASATKLNEALVRVTMVGLLSVRLGVSTAEKHGMYWATGRDRGYSIA